MNWFRKWFPSPVKVFCLRYDGDWREFNARQTASGLVVVMWPNIGHGVHFLNEDGTVTGEYLTEWRRA